MIRKMIPQDSKECVEMAIQFHKESNYCDIPLSIEKNYNNFENVWTQSHNFYPLVAVDDDNKIYGMFVGFIDYYYFSDSVFASDLFWYVTPNKRGSYAAIGFLKRFERWARLKSARELRCSIGSGINTDIVNKIYNRLGYETVGFKFKKEIK